MRKDATPRPVYPIFEEDPKAKPLRFLNFMPGEAAVNYGRFVHQRGTIYVLECQGFHKIGMTRKKAVEQRCIELQIGNPFPLNILCYSTVPLAGMAYGESWLHHQFAGRRMHNEWFAVGGDEIQEALPEAVLRALAYDRHCRDYEVLRRVERFRGMMRAPDLADTPMTRADIEIELSKQKQRVN